MLTRFVRNQLIIFTIASIIGMAVMLFAYMQVPTLLGVGKINVKLELPASGGLYQFSNVTYRGVQIGKVTSVDLTDTGAVATMSLDTSPKIPADLAANVRSISAVGEQFVDLVPRTKSGPYLQDGSVIPVKEASIPQPVGPMLDQVSKLLDTIPQNKIAQLLDESFKAFNGAGFDIQSLLDSASKLSGDINGISDQTRALVDDTGPLLDGQAQTSDSIKIWSRSFAGISGTLQKNDPQIRNILQTAPGAVSEASALLNQIKPTLPVLLANLNTVGQVLVTYNPGIEQLLVILPAYIAAQQSFGLPKNNPTGLPLGEFSAMFGDPPPCTVGFLPPSQWRSPADLSDIDTPDGLYCKLPQDSPISVRGARNIPCMDKPGKRAPTVEICQSDLPYEPLAMRQHATGPYPIDPNLVSQGIPVDDRVTFNDNIYGPLEGTPRPPGPVPAAAPPAEAPLAPAAAQLPPAPEGVAPPADPAGPLPGPAAAPAPDGGAVPVAPSSYGANATGTPKLAVAYYDPQNGRYLTPDGQYRQQSSLVAGGAPKTWKDLLPT
ncbi:MCE family protein [Mycobacterium sp. NBC_00419]|uniref:MlaD family protein n=1 Tax=Mycobacterium sp. NBC_00419 TaxID=2975989 RepID=UPI002E21FC80